MKNRLLVVDDEPGHRLMVRAVMQDAGWSVTEADSGEAALAFLDRADADAVLLDMRMPGMDGIAALKEIHALDPYLPVVMLTAHGTVHTAVEAMKLGAFDFLTKPADNEELKAVLAKAAEYGRTLRAGSSARPAPEFGVRIVGQSPGVREVLEFISRAGPAEATVLILGPSGTGKELVAEALHKASPRKDKPLIKVNCAALPAELLESELFGYEKGAFTGAVKNKPGRFQLADTGTLFLDEIGEMPPALQAKLLRVLQERLVEPLGSVRPVPVDIRVICATNKDLTREVEAGRFREDLYYRLNVLEVRLPPLSQRMEDLPLLVEHFLAELGRKNNRPVRGVTPEFMRVLESYDWPGNIRELQNVLERALILSRSETLDASDVPEKIRKGDKPSGAGGEQKLESLDQAEKNALIQALEAHGGHRARTAEALGISRRTLQYKLSKYDLTEK